MKREFLNQYFLREGERMDREKSIRLYEKERAYEEIVFGDYKQLPNLNLSSFLLFIERYINEAKESYAGPWVPNEKDSIPDWLSNCKELQDLGHCPDKTYECLIKIFALAGAALETYSEIDIDKWRFGLEPKGKWSRNEK